MSTVTALSCWTDDNQLVTIYCDPQHEADMMRHMLEEHHRTIVSLAKA